MPVSDREEKIEDVVSIISMHESVMTDFVNSLLNTEKFQVKSGDRFDQITEYRNNSGLKVDPNFKHWITKERIFTEL